MGLHLVGRSVRESLPPAGLLKVPLNLRLDPQMCEFGGVKSGRFGAAGALLVNLRLFCIRNGPGMVGSESGQMKGVGWYHRGGR